MAASDRTHLVILSPEALRNLQEIRAHIAEQGSPLEAQRHAARILAAIDTLEQFPGRGRLVRGNIRELAIVTPHLIRYRIRDRKVEVLRIRHGARRPD